MSKHKWSKNDDIVACYLYRFGNDSIPSTKEIGEILGMGEGSLKMRVQNIKSIASGDGLRHYAIQTAEIYKDYKDTSRDEFLIIVREILNSHK